jgi:hypothetical protein
MSPEILAGIGTIAGGVIGYVVKHFFQSNDKPALSSPGAAVTVNTNDVSATNKFCGQAHVDLCIAMVEVKADIKQVKNDMAILSHGMNEQKQGVVLANDRMHRIMQHMGIK